MKKASQAVPNKHLLAERLKRHWSQQDVADQLGTTRINVSRWECGITTPSPYFRNRLCTLFAKSREELGLASRGLADADADRKSETDKSSLRPSSSQGILDISSSPSSQKVRNLFFTGRASYLTAIYELFHQANASQLCVCALKGLAGIGKTQIAIEYAYQYRNQYTKVLWIEGFVRSALTFTPFFSEPRSEMAKKVDEDYQQSDTILLLIDNVTDLAITDKIPLALNHRYHILLTTRNQVGSESIQSFNVEKMPAEEGALFFLRRIRYIRLDTPLEAVPEPLRGGALQISHLLDGHPLALNQAGAYVEEAACSPADYLKLYHTHHTMLLGLPDATSLSDYPLSFNTAIASCISHVEQASTSALTLLRLCSFLSPAGIPEELCLRGNSISDDLHQDTMLDPLAFNTALVELRKHSLIERDAQTKTLTMHRLVQLTVQHSMNEYAKRIWIELAIQAVLRFFPNRTSNFWQRHRYYHLAAEACVEHVLHEAITTSEALQLAYGVGQYFLETAQYAKAETLCNRLIELCNKEQPTDTPEVLPFICLLAKLSILQEHLDQAEHFCQRAFTLSKQVPEHTSVVECLAQLELLEHLETQQEQVEASSLVTLAPQREVTASTSSMGNFSSGTQIEARVPLQNKQWLPFHRKNNAPGPLAQYRLSGDKEKLEKLRRKRSTLFRQHALTGAGIFIGILILSNILFARPFLFSLVNGPGATQMNALPSAFMTIRSLSQELALEKQYIQKDDIGISDGSYIFDMYAGRKDDALKNQAAQQLQQYNFSGAVNLLAQAVSTDPTDGEAQIYNEDLHVLQSGNPYVTIVLGLAIANNETDLVRARSIMQGAFLAQHEINTNNLLPNTLRLRLLIDNSGVDNANVAIAAQFIANRARLADDQDHIIAVVGWPYSIQVNNARDIIGSAHLPIVSQTASSMSLSGSNPYFFRVNPVDDQQAHALGSIAVNELHAKTILLAYDPTDPYSVSLSNGFVASVTPQNVKVITNPAYNFTEGVTTMASYQQDIVSALLTNHVDAVFMAGFDTDVIRLAHAIGNAYRADPTNQQLAHLKIIAGDAVGTNLILGQGNGPDAAIAKNYPEDMARLIFSAFANPEEWSFEKVPPGQQPSFFTDWFNIYATSLQNTGVSFPGDHAILTYDAVRVLSAATMLVHGPLTGDAVRRALTLIGKGNIPAFQGVSGLIAFDGQGNPINKVVVILEVDLIDSKAQVVIKEVLGNFR